VKTNRRFLYVIVGSVLLAFIAGYLIRDQLERSEPPTQAQYLYLPIIGCDSNTYERHTDFYVRIDGKATLAAKVQSLANQLSRLRFGGLPIEVKSIEPRDGRTVAIINLREADSTSRYSWRTGYFQGSTGGLVTSAVLIETFLQRDYAGEWFDGVQFLYEGGPILDFDHVPALSYVAWRDSLPRY